MGAGRVNILEDEKIGLPSYSKVCTLCLNVSSVNLFLEEPTFLLKGTVMNFFVDIDGYVTSVKGIPLRHLFESRINYNSTVPVFVNALMKI